MVAAIDLSFGVPSPLQLQTLAIDHEYAKCSRDFGPRYNYRSCCILKPSQCAKTLGNDTNDKVPEFSCRPNQANVDES